MPLRLNAPISNPPEPAALDMLNNLQPNIVAPHVRQVLSILFLRFTDQESARDFLGNIRRLMKSAAEHLEELERFKRDRSPGTPYIGVGISASGYDALGIKNSPPDRAFRRGMQKAQALNDPDPAKWDVALREEDSLHACILIGDAELPAQSAAHDRVKALIDNATGVTMLGPVQHGLGQQNDAGEGVEHFGYVDGRSQPLFFTSNVVDESPGSEGTDAWSPLFPLDQVLVPDAAAPDPERHFGSYFVFRKLEQDVKKFKTAERDLAEAMALEFSKVSSAPDGTVVGPLGELAGAMLVGRFEDGTPVTLQNAEGMHHPVPNNFNYNGDKGGGKCPFSSHIRKTNPRGSGGFENLPQERRHLMVRRGQTYGIRDDDLNDGQLDNKPSKDVGLLFMAFNSSIEDQFEFMQVKWANSFGFPKTPSGDLPGPDPIIGQTGKNISRPKIRLPLEWGNPTKTFEFQPFPQTVTMKGGGYFFMPSLAFFDTFAPPVAAL